MTRHKNPSTADRNDNSDTVGYCRPPKQHQFKKGQSGNPGGRPRNRLSHKSLKLIGREEFLRPITIVEGGKRKKLPLIQALLRKSLSEALSGSGPLSKLTFDFLRSLLRSGDYNELSIEESLQSMRDYRPILNIEPGADIPENPIL